MFHAKGAKEQRRKGIRFAKFFSQRAQGKAHRVAQRNINKQYNSQAPELWHYKLQCIHNS
jgi:hypothetical protein